MDGAIGAKRVRRGSCVRLKKECIGRSLQDVIFFESLELGWLDLLISCCFGDPLRSLFRHF